MTSEAECVCMAHGSQHLELARACEKLELSAWAQLEESVLPGKESSFRNDTW